MAFVLDDRDWNGYGVVIERNQKTFTLTLRTEPTGTSDEDGWDQREIPLAEFCKALGLQPVNEEVRGGPEREWYTVLVQGGTDWEDHYPLRGIYLWGRRAADVEERAERHLDRCEVIVGVFVGRLIDELSRIGFMEVRGGENS